MQHGILLIYQLFSVARPHTIQYNYHTYNRYNPHTTHTKYNIQNTFGSDEMQSILRVFEVLFEKDTWVVLIGDGASGDADLARDFS